MSAVLMSASFAPAASHAALRDYLDSQLRSRKAEYCELHDLTVLCVTWNVNGREPCEDLAPLVTAVMPPDIVVVGLQEVDRRAEAYVSTVNSREELWTSALLAVLNAQNLRYARLASKIYVGLFIAVFVREEHLLHASQVTTASASCGMMNIVGNKGGVAVSFKLYADDFCFVNCHLAAHMNQVTRRNQDFSDLHRRLLSSDARFVVWMGDFNYRVEMESDLARVLVGHKEFAPLLQHDQLLGEQSRGGELAGYTEAAILFPPSYHFDVGTDCYDTSEKQRVPSWCDRILWRTGDLVEPLRYDSVPVMRSSDHKPVRLIASLLVNHVIPDRYEATMLRLLDAFDNAAIPDTAVTPHFVDAGIVAYRQTAVVSCRLINRGAVPAQYCLQAVPFWLTVKAREGIVPPGQTVDLSLMCVYDDAVARGDIRQFDDVLVLHVEGGRDHFITVSFSARDTAFGRPLAQLRFHRVMLDRQRPDIVYRTPTVLWRLVEYLMGPGVRVDNLFLLTGDRNDMEMLQDALDCNEPFLDDSRHRAAAACILRFFEALPDSLIPSQLFSRCVTENARPQQVINDMSEHNIWVLQYIVAFVRDIVLPRNASLSASTLARVFGVVLLRKPEGVSVSRREARDIGRFFLRLFE